MVCSKNRIHSSNLPTLPKKSSKILLKMDYADKVSSVVMTNNNNLYPIRKTWKEIKQVIRRRKKSKVPKGVTGMELREEVMMVVMVVLIRSLVKVERVKAMKGTNFYLIGEKKRKLTCVLMMN